MGEDAKRSRAFCFTDYELNEDFLKGLPCKYLCFGRETCPKTKRLHLQGYIYFASAKSFSACRKLMAPRHIKVCDGDPQSNITYCSKEQDFYEQGERPTQGKRTDIHSVRDAIRTGDCTLRDVLGSASSYQAVRMAEVNLKYFEPPRNWKPEVYWFHGSTGCGKSHAAYQMCEDPFPCMEDTKWWEGYDGHEDVIIDDYRRSFCKFSTLLRILDRYAYRVECKGGSRQLRAKRIIITCPYRPEVVWEGRTCEDLQQLLRRIDYIREFNTPYEDPDLKIYRDPLGDFP